MKRYDKTAQMIGQLIGSSAHESGAGPVGSSYQLKALLGQQTGRRTFLASDIRTAKQVVVKLLLFGPDFTWEDLKLFEREAETLKSLDHPAIPKYLDSFEVETVLGSGFILVQTYIEAKSLQSQVSLGRRFDESALVAIARALLEILQYLHAQYPVVVHRDIKPSNILLSDRTTGTPSSVYLVDFGSVQTVQTSGTMTVVGTYGYMPPEQFGGRAQPASDLYSLGATLIYLATGQHPADLFQSDGSIACAEHRDLSPLQTALVGHSALSSAFSNWIMQLTHSHLSKRTSSAQQALEQLTCRQFVEPPATLERTSLPRRNVVFPLTPTFRNFKVVSTVDKLDIQLPLTRARRLLTLTTEDAGHTAILTKLIIFMVLFYFSSLMLASPVLVLIFFIFLASGTPKGQRRKALDCSHIMLWFPANRPAQLRLVAGNQRDHTPATSDLPCLTLTTITTSSQNNHLYFHVKSNKGDGELCLHGHRSEIQWLCEHLSEWQDIPIRDD